MPKCGCHVLNKKYFIILILDEKLIASLPYAERLILIPQKPLECKIMVFKTSWLTKNSCISGIRLVDEAVKFWVV